MIKRLLVSMGAALLPLLAAAAAQSQAWQTYRNAAAGFAFDYPAGAHVSTEQDASQGYASIFVALPDEGAGYQGYAVAVFANPDDLPLPRFLIERRGFTVFGGQNLRLNGVDALRAAPDTALAEDDAASYWLRGDGVVVRLGLYAGRDPSIGPSKAAQAAFDRAVTSFHLIPREATAPITPFPVAIPSLERPELIDAFSSPYGVISTTTVYADQWNVITNDTRYGVRNLSLTGRKCYGVAWDRMLHSGIDLYRGDGQDAAGTQLVATADGTVAYYDPGYTSYPGHVVILSHPLSDGRVLYSMYAHLGSVIVTQGQIVTRGQLIGTVLNQWPDSHLHFELRWFLDGTSIYPPYPATTCNGIVYGRGYTYLVHPDDFPAPDQGYVDPDAFIQSHGGLPLTPIGLPDPRTPVLSVPAASADVQIGLQQFPIASAPPSVKPSPFDLGGPEAEEITESVKVAPVLSAPAVITAPITILLSPEVTLPAPGVVNTDTLTYTMYLPLIVRNYPKQQPACVDGQDLLSNRGFEDGPGSAPWWQVRNGTSDLISTTQHYSGMYSLWLGGRNTADEEVLQSFIVPYYTDAVTLTFKRLLTTQETEPKVYDHFEFVLENQVGNEVSPQVAFSNLSANRNVWAAETAVFSGLTNWGNRRLRLSIKGMTDSNLLTSLFVDDVSLQPRCIP